MGNSDHGTTYMRVVCMDLKETHTKMMLAFPRAPPLPASRVTGTDGRAAAGGKASGKEGRRVNLRRLVLVGNVQPRRPVLPP